MFDLREKKNGGRWKTAHTQISLTAVAVVSQQAKKHSMSHQSPVFLFPPQSLFFFPP